MDSCAKPGPSNGSTTAAAVPRGPDGVASNGVENQAAWPQMLPDEQVRVKPGMTRTDMF